MDHAWILRVTSMASLCLLLFPTTSGENGCKAECAATGGVCYQPLSRCDCPQAEEVNPDQCKGDVSGSKYGPKLPLGTEDEREKTLQRYKCMNECNNRGTCTWGFCLCQKGYFGVDCALSERDGEVVVLDGVWPETAPPQQGNSGALSPKIYIYDLPSPYTVMPVSDRPLDMGIAERITHSGHRVGDPAQADYFFMPLNTRFLRPDKIVEAIQYIRQTWPYFDRKEGADHMLVHPGDWGPCQMLSPNAAFCSGPMCTRPADVLGKLMYLQHWGMTETSKPFGNTGPCYVPGRDILLPPIQPIRGLREQAQSPYWQGDCDEQKPGKEKPECSVGSHAGIRNITFFFAGDYEKPWIRADVYSGGVRKQIFDLFEKGEPGFEIYKHTPLYEHKLASSVFCLAPAGAGWGRRAVLAALFGCIPVIIQDNVLQAYDELLPWEQFSVRVPEKEIPQLPGILRAIPAAQIASMQAALKCVHEKLMWTSLYGTTFGEDGTNDAFAALLYILAQRLKSKDGNTRLKNACDPIPPAAQIPPGKRLCHYMCSIEGSQHPWPPGGAMHRLIDSDTKRVHEVTRKDSERAVQQMSAEPTQAHQGFDTGQSAEKNKKTKLAKWLAHIHRENERLRKHLHAPRGQ